MNRILSPSTLVIGLLLSAMITPALSCQQGEAKGTYEVELQIPRIPEPLSGTLILSTLPLDLSSPSSEDESVDLVWGGRDALSVNSCFILAPGRRTKAGAAEEPNLVRVFDARIESNGVRMPIEILNTNDVRIEITELRFFADVVAGEIDVHTQNGSQRGRITGTRVDSTSSRQCVTAVVQFQKFLRDLARAEELATPRRTGPPIQTELR